MENKNEVKKDITDEDLKAFEEAEEKGEVKNGEERTLDEPKEEKPKEEPEENKDEDEEDDDEDDDEEKSSDETAEASTAEIKDVEGETPREKALRLEVTRLRKKNREKAQSETFKSNNEENDDSEKELKELGYDDDQIKTLDKAFDIIGKRKGFVRKDQSYQEMANDTLSVFIEEHPEYSPENDKEDIYWGRFNSILKSDYKLTGKTQKQLKTIFEKVDRDVKEELGETSSKSKIEAQQQKIKSVSTGASTSKGKTEPKPEKKTVSGSHPGLKFSGFDDDEIEEFIK